MSTRPLVVFFLLFFGLISCDGLDLTTGYYEVRAVADPAEGGVVLPTTDTLLAEGIQIELEAQGTGGYAFERWSGDLESTENPLSFVVYEDYELVAHFTKKKHELSVQNEGKGEVTERIVRNKKYEHGTVVELTAGAGQGYEFVEWTGDISSAENPHTLVMDGPKSVTAVYKVKNTSAVADVNVAWNEFDNAFGEAFTDSITHVGVNLFYPGQGVDSLRTAVSKGDSELPELISLESKTQGPARLLATAVYNVEGEEKALLFGTVEDLDIQFGTQYNWTVSDFEWRKASWRVVDSLAVEYEEGVFVRDKNDRDFRLWFLVNTPFQTNETTNFEDLFVRVEGFGSGEGSYRNGFREFFMEALNSNRGTENTEIYRFRPYLVPGKFGLPVPSNNTGYLIQQEGEFTVEWQ